jgi:acyl-CoA thioester hydrolase
VTDRNPPGDRAAYARFVSISTRWRDNDIYGHVNNAVYYDWIDTAVNRVLLEAGVLDIHAGPVIGLAVESGCRYHAPAAFPDRIDAGVRVARLGSSSVRYEVGLFRNDDGAAAAEGHFVHVYVDRGTRRPVPLPPALRAFLGALAR